MQISDTEDSDTVLFDSLMKSPLVNLTKFLSRQSHTTLQGSSKSLQAHSIAIVLYRPLRCAQLMIL